MDCFTSQARSIVGLLLSQTLDMRTDMQTDGQRQIYMFVLMLMLMGYQNKLLSFYSHKIL